MTIKYQLAGKIFRQLGMLGQMLVAMMVVVGRCMSRGSVFNEIMKYNINVQNPLTIFSQSDMSKFARWVIIDSSDLMLKAEIIGH